MRISARMEANTSDYPECKSRVLPESVARLKDPTLKLRL